MVRSGEVTSGLMPCMSDDPFVNYHMCVCDEKNATLNYNLTEHCFFGYDTVVDLVPFDKTRHNLTDVVMVNNSKFIEQAREVVNTNCSQWCVTRDSTRTAADIYF